MHVKPSFFRARQASKQLSQTKWTSDHSGAGGKSSMGVLLDWLVVQGNYNRWRSCSATGGGLRSLADEIVQRLHAEGLVHRTASQVQAKMAELELSYREAAERLASTKRELQAAQGTPAERNLHRVLERHCRYFALLQPIMKDIDKEVDAPPSKRPRLSTKRKAVKVAQQSVAAANLPPPSPAPAPDVAPARAASPSPAKLRSRSPSPAKKRSRYQLRERRGLVSLSEDTIWDFDNESVGGMRGPFTPPTPPTTRPERRSKNLAMQSISVMQLEDDEEEERGQVRRRRDQPSSPVKKRPMLSSIDEIDLEKARVELTLRQLELQMARDKALVARAKARAQLLDQGVSRREVDRLMPLDI
ncbi:hypothetical protein PR003_g19752 [Phytophthora rubi]|uniref:Uncharacterized protein n=1 Tax=Phytophthora rubi TaxID=129364 RepID=A0A6A3JXV2_9STRA|nr:hypothetical protein PR002_g19103 [Phytophthora rubi]KAE9000405.1 hypothetical protein PR001_g18794 [Phytophthora rubi]KAE9312471.1 hypothetical protein PR003_g19752 [Phytophthora rubi]